MAPIRLAKPPVFSRRLALGAAAMLLAAIVSPSNAQTGTVKIVVPSAAGGGADILSRLLADQISRTQGATMIVENRPGAGNTIGTEAVSRAAPDGNTVLISTPEFVINPHLRKLSYDPLTSFESVCYLARSPQILVVNSNSSYRTLDDFFKAAREKPGTLTIASAGPASSPHIAIETLRREANVNITYVPYPGSAPAVNALLGGHITSVLASYPNVVGQVKSGQLRALAATSLSRLQQFPDVPTVAESGFKDFEADLWFGTAVPAKTPQQAIAKLSGWFRAALQVPEIRSKLEAQGLFPVGTCGTQFDAFIRKQYEQFGRTIREANIKPR
ncbi:MAG: tripartite tricarboxylate transporter substrate binding protein [Rhizobiales bacterium]|nr:tripartite tricarboxylate transporter substrate binding protein [Hyphomicrobiales bacterium]